MKRNYSGRKYSFEVEFEPHRSRFLFTITAIHKKSRRYSVINTLNPILSEFGIETDNVRQEQSEWELTKKEVQTFRERASAIFTCKDYLRLLDQKLDEDRECGEWENKKQVKRKK